MIASIEDSFRPCVFCDVLFCPGPARGELEEPRDAEGEVEDDLLQDDLTGHEESPASDRASGDRGPGLANYFTNSLEASSSPVQSSRRGRPAWPPTGAFHHVCYVPSIRFLFAAGLHQTTST